MITIAKMITIVEASVWNISRSFSWAFPTHTQWQNQLKIDPLPLLLIRLIIKVHCSVRESKVWAYNQGGKAGDTTDSILCLFEILP